jgi:hypothetical protein
MRTEFVIAAAQLQEIFEVIFVRPRLTDAIALHSRQAGRFGVKF